MTSRQRSRRSSSSPRPAVPTSRPRRRRAELLTAAGPGLDELAAAAASIDDIAIDPAGPAHHAGSVRGAHRCDSVKSNGGRPTRRRTIGRRGRDRGRPAHRGRAGVPRARDPHRPIAPSASVWSTPPTPSAPGRSCERQLPARVGDAGSPTTDQFCESCGAALSRHDRARGCTARRGESGTRPRSRPRRRQSITQPVPAPVRRSARAAVRSTPTAAAPSAGCAPRANATTSREQPAPNVAVVCDKGLVHPRNEDAMALAIADDRVVLVVCDGVTSSTDSDVASLGRGPRGSRRARRRRPHRRPRRPRGRALDRRARPGDRRGAGAGRGRGGHGRRDRATRRHHVRGRGRRRCRCSCRRGWATAAATGSPTTAPPIQVSIDDSWASAADRPGHRPRRSPRPIRGRTRSPGGSASTPHAGAPSSASVPRRGRADGCSCAATGSGTTVRRRADLAGARDRRIADVGDDPLTVASALCNWANDQGGHDNVTVALAHLPVASAPRPTSPLPNPPSANRPEPDEENLMADWTTEVFENEYLRRRRHRRARDRVDRPARAPGPPVSRGRGRGDHRRHVGLDVVPADARSSSVAQGRGGRDRRDRRRHAGSR